MLQQRPVHAATKGRCMLQQRPVHAATKGEARCNKGQCMLQQSPMSASVDTALVVQQTKADDVRLVPHSVVDMFPVTRQQFCGEALCQFSDFPL